MNVTSVQANNISRDMVYVLKYHVPPVDIDIIIDEGDDIQRKYHQVHWTLSYKKYYDYYSSYRQIYFRNSYLSTVNYILSYLGEYVGYPEDSDE